MIHGRKFNHLSRTSSHRKAMLTNLACALIKYKRINTTLSKAKALRRYVEPLLTNAKKDTTHSQRIVYSYLQNKLVMKELFREIGEKIIDRPGGYTRIIKLGFRKGDNAEMAMIELVDYNQHLLQDKQKAESLRKRKRSRRSRRKKNQMFKENKK